MLSALVVKRPLDVPQMGELRDKCSRAGIQKVLDTKLGHHCGCHSKQHTNNKKNHIVTKVQNIIQETLEGHKIGLVRAKEKRKGMVQN